jgi:hypothetical protein
MTTPKGQVPEAPYLQLAELLASGQHLVSAERKEAAAAIRSLHAQVAALTAAQEMPKCEFLAHGCDTPSYCQSVQRCTARDEKRAPPAQPAAPQGVAYAEMPKITAEDRSFLHYNPNTDDIVKWVQDYARACIDADRASHGQAPAGALTCRILNDADMDLMVTWMGQQERGDIGFARLAELIIHNFAAPTPQPAPAGATFQQRVQPWLLECFGAEIAADRVERNHRFLEESLELVQALGCTPSEAHQLVDYVFGRPVGDPPQEVGGVMVTLAALCLASGLDMHDAGEVELARISAPELVAKIRAKQAAKPKHSPLPEAPSAQAAPAAGAVAGPSDRQIIAAYRAYNGWPTAVLERGDEAARWKQALIAALAAAPTPAAQADSQPARVRELDTDEVHGTAQNLYWGKQSLQDAFERGAHWAYRRGVSAAKEAAAHAQADSVLEDAALLDWLALAGPTSICVVIDREHDGEVEVSTDDVTGYGKTLREALNAARKQGAKHD